MNDVTPDQIYLEREYRHWLRTYVTTPSWFPERDSLRAMVREVRMDALRAGCSRSTIRRWLNEVKAEVNNHVH